MNPYSGHPGYPNGPYVPGQQSPSFPDVGGAAAGGDAAAGGHGHGHGGAATRRWQRHDALAPLGTPGSSSIGSISGGGTSSSFGFAPSPHYGGGGGGGGSSSSSSLGSASWLPQVQHAPHLQQQQHLQRLQQQHRQRGQQQQQQQQDDDDDDDGDDDEEGEEDETLQQQQQQQQQYWPHASVQKPQNPLQRSPPMRSPRWLMQHVANGRGGNSNGGGGVAPAYTVGSEGHVGGHGSYDGGTHGGR